MKLKENNYNNPLALRVPGFSLLEMLLVIIIIAIILTVTSLATNNIRAKMRDSQRIADVKMIQTALASYRADNGFFPSVLTPNMALVGPTGKTYLEKIPTAPGRADGSCSGDTYDYNPEANGTAYTLDFCLGGVAMNSVIKTNCTAVPGALCGETAVAGLQCSGNTPYLSPDGTECLSSPECPVDVCGDGTSLSCGSTDYATNGSLTLNGSNASAYGTSTVTYQAIKIGTQCWMSKNVNMGDMILGATSMSGNASSSIKRYCYNNDVNICNTDGALYNWAMAMYLPGLCNSWATGTACTPSNFLTGSGASAKRQGLCPLGWHVPSDFELMTMERYIDSSIVAPLTPSVCASNYGFYADVACKYTGAQWGDRGTNIGTKLKVGAGGTSNMNIILAGVRQTGAFSTRGTSGRIWSANKYPENYGWYRSLSSTNALSSRASIMATAVSLRCIKDYYLGFWFFLNTFK